MKSYSDIDSKFRFVIVSAKRAKQLLKGAKPRVKSKSKNLIRIAQEEVMRGKVDFEIIQSRPEDMKDTDDDIFIGEELGIEGMDVEVTGEDMPREALKGIDDLEELDESEDEQDEEHEEDEEDEENEEQEDEEEGVSAEPDDEASEKTKVSKKKKKSS